MRIRLWPHLIKLLLECAIRTTMGCGDPNTSKEVPPLSAATLLGIPIILRYLMEAIVLQAEKYSPPWSNSKFYVFCMR